MLTFGFSLRTCIRLCSLIGIAVGGLNVAAGTLFILWGKRQKKVGPYSKPSYLYQTVAERDSVKQYQMLYTLHIIVGGILIAFSIIQILIDTTFIIFTVAPCRSKYIWTLFGLGIIVWIASLICFTSLLSTGGLTLLVIVLLGTSLRCYILYVNYIFLEFLTSSNGAVDSSKIHVIQNASDLNNGMTKTAKPELIKNSNAVFVNSLGKLDKSLNGH